MLKELLYLGPEQRLRRLLSSICVQNLNRATPAMKMWEIKQPIRKGIETQNYFRTQIEQYEPI
jgi:hypothetical protein